MTLGDRIRQAREQADISQAELARRIGISKNAMNTIEGGQSDPRVSRIVAIARVLGVSTDTLLGFQDDAHVAPRTARTHADVQETTPTPQRPGTRTAAPVA